MAKCLVFFGNNGKDFPNGMYILCSTTHMLLLFGIVQPDIRLMMMIISRKKSEGRPKTNPPGNLGNQALLCCASRKKNLSQFPVVLPPFLLCWVKNDPVQLQGICSEGGEKSPGRKKAAWPSGGSALTGFSQLFFPEKSSTSSSSRSLVVAS